jgi:putative drug exporter of the RND superfamily
VFARWGRFVYRRRRLVAVAAMLLAVASLALAGRASESLSSGGWVVSDSESAAVTERLARDFGAGRSSLIVLYRSEAAPAASESVQGAIAESLSALAADARVADVVGYAETRDDRFISTDGSATYVVVQLEATDEESIDQVESLRALIRPQEGLTYQLTGYGPLALAANVQSEEDLQRAEAVSLPLALLILVAVFASLVAAGLPLLVAGLAIPSTLALVHLVAQRTEMSIYVLNVATMLGLALAIDYSLFMVSRFREELRHGRSVEEAVERTVATSGKAVLFSGIAVAIGLLGLLFFASPAISSMGIGGSLVVVSSVFYALTFLPALLGILGPRVDALSIGALGRALGRRGRGGPEVAPGSSVDASAWARVARWVMAHPVAVLVPTLAVLLLAGAPYLRIQQSVPDASVFPPGLESRDAFVALTEEFPRGATTPYVVLADIAGDPASPENVVRLAEYAERLTALDGVDGVETFFTVLRDPRSGRPLDLTPQELGALFADPALRPQLRPVVDRYVRGSTVRMDAVSPIPPSAIESQRLTEDVRAVDPGDGIVVEVGGVAASGYDNLASMRERTPWAIGSTLLVSATVLFLLFGSVVLPVKAVLMTLLSITASFGALVWIFQEGNLSDLLHFEPLGYTVAGNPIIMFAVLFGLSMDYEVLLLSRIQEAFRRTGDNTASVAEGLARTAGVITGAAMIMVTVFAAFALAEIITIKSIGVGMAIAVFLDATIIRVLLVPATMRLMGRWNWWAPGPLGRLAERLGFSHVEDAETPRPVAGRDAPAGVATAEP